MRTILAAAALLLALGSQAFAQGAGETSRPPSDGSVTVPGVIERPVPTPPGDPRTPSRRMRDIKSWDKCVLRAQSHGDTDPMRPQLETPEDYCRERLGMSSRTSVPFDHQDND